MTLTALLWAGLGTLIGVALLARFRPHLRRTRFGLAKVFVTRVFPEGPARVLSVGGAWQSVMLLDDPECLVVPYVRALDAIFRAPVAPRRVLAIGGGGFSYPAHLARRHVRVTAVEIDPAVVAIARRYFGLGEAEALRDESGRRLLEVRVGDGLGYLAGTRETFDAIVVDAYRGLVGDAGTRSEAAMGLYRAHLSKAGVVAVNVASAGDETDDLERWANLLLGAFAHTYVVSCTASTSSFHRNHVVVASDEPLALGEAVEL